ncbi:MAG: hypothetical protein ABIQ39_13275, partial [Ilumatobacteraceae bacterium]
MKLPDVRSEFFVPKGGQDIVSPALLLANGVAFDAINWEAGLEAGYSVSGGYDKFVNGKTVAEMNIRVAVVSVTTGFISSGETLVGDTSGARFTFGVRFDGALPQLVTGGMTNVAVYVT